MDYNDLLALLGLIVIAITIAHLSVFLKAEKRRNEERNKEFDKLMKMLKDPPENRKRPKP